MAAPDSPRHHIPARLPWRLLSASRRPRTHRCASHHAAAAVSAAAALHGMALRPLPRLGVKHLPLVLELCGLLRTYGERRAADGAGR